MGSILISVGLALGLLINHLIYGWGCWGLQPGGGVSAKLYLIQLIVAGIACLKASIDLIQAKVPGGISVAIIVILSAAGAGVLCFTDGWTIFTSIHNQGPEKLLPFGAASGAAILAGAASSWALRQKRAVVYRHLTAEQDSPPNV